MFLEGIDKLHRAVLSQGFKYYLFPRNCLEIKAELSLYVNQALPWY